MTGTNGEKLQELEVAVARRARSSCALAASTTWPRFSPAPSNVLARSTAATRRADEDLRWAACSGGEPKMPYARFDA